MVDRLPHGEQHGLDPFQILLMRPDHEAECALLRRPSRTRDGCVDKPDAMLGGGCRQLARRHGAHHAAVYER